MDEQSGENSPEFDISGFGSQSWARPGDKPGTLCTGVLTVPDTITPGALLVTYTGAAPEAKKPDSNRVRKATAWHRAIHLRIGIATSCQCEPSDGCCSDSLHVHRTAMICTFSNVAEGGETECRRLLSEH